MAYQTISVAILLIVALAGYAFWSRMQNSSKLPLPPQPPGIPLLGNLPEFLKALAANKPHILLAKWAQEYGEIIRVQVGPVTEYYLNSDRAVKVLFDQKSAQTAERPRWIVSNELLCNKWNPLLLDASEQRWKHHRKIITSELTSPARADAGIPFLDLETAKFLYNVAHDPKAGTRSQDLWAMISRYTYSAFAAQSMGFTIPEENDPAIKFIHSSGLEQIIQTFPGSNIVDIMPWLEHLPLFLKPWERRAKALFRRDLRWVCAKLDVTRQQVREKSAPDAFLPRVLADEKRKGFEQEEEAAFLAFNLIIGAADTSQMSTWIFLEAMVNFPDVQEKAREEIEKVVGNDRLPEWNDFESIPYIRCLMKETWRWRPPVALGHPHRTTREIEYEGMRIPKGARLHLNAWAIQRDPRRHEQPDRFWPERFVDDHTTTQQSINSADPSKRDHFAFGAGRRICPGYHVAERSLAIAIMRILWAFDVKAAPGAELPCTADKYPGPVPGVASEKLPIVLTLRTEQKLKVIDDVHRRNQSGKVTGQ